MFLWVWVCACKCRWLRRPGETIRQWSWSDLQSWRPPAKSMRILCKCWVLSSPQVDRVDPRHLEDWTGWLEDEQWLGCSCVMVALCDKQQQTHAVWNLVSVLSGILSTVFHNTPLSAQAQQSVRHVPLHPHSLTALLIIQQAHRRQFCFSNKALGLW